MYKVSTQHIYKIPTNQPNLHKDPLAVVAHCGPQMSIAHLSYWFVTACPAFRHLVRTPPSSFPSSTVLFLHHSSFFSPLWSLTRDSHNDGSLAAKCCNLESCGTKCWAASGPMYPRLLRTIKQIKHKYTDSLVLSLLKINSWWFYRHTHKKRSANILSWGDIIIQSWDFFT